jgi:hypothetical protein
MPTPEKDRLAAEVEARWIDFNMHCRTSAAILSKSLGNSGTPGENTLS